MYNDFSPFNYFYPDAKLIQAGAPEHLKGKGFLIIWGGGDIHPSLYGKPNIASSVGEKPSKRDQWEAILMQTAVQLGIPIVGVCRGAQLGCALAGGILIQDVSGHGGDHLIRTNDDQTMITSSLHHQMLYPWDVDHELIAWSDPKLSSRYEGLTDEEEAMRNPKEPEIVWFSKIKCLAIQGHPEFMDPKCQFNRYVKSLIDKYVMPFISTSKDG